MRDQTYKAVRQLEAQERLNNKERQYYLVEIEKIKDKLRVVEKQKHRYGREMMRLLVKQCKSQTSSH